MGNRAYVCFTDGETYSPIVYLHCDADEVPAWLEELETLMVDRPGDVEYAAARFCGIAHTHIPGNLGLGLYPPPDEEEQDNFYVVSSDGIGYVVDCHTWKRAVIR